MTAAIRRGYVDCRFGQLHVTTARPMSVSNKPAVLCFHHSPHSAEVYRDFLPAMASDRIVHAPDTPGFGQSDYPPSPPEISDYAAAMVEFVDRLDPGPIDIVGYHTGSLIAIDVALARPNRVRKLFLVCIPVITDSERRRFEAEPWPPPIREDGSHVMTEWQRSVTWRHPKMTTEQVAESFARKLRGGDRAAGGGRAAFRYPTADRLPRVTQEILCINTRDDMYEITPRAAPLIRNGAMIEVEDWGFGIFYVYSRDVAARAREFFDRQPETFNEL